VLFLRAVALETGASVSIHCVRIEEIVEKIPPVDVVTARALKPLPQLLSLAHSKMAQGAIGVFPKGRELANELTLVDTQGSFLVDCFDSLTSAGSRIVKVRSKLISNLT